MSFPLHSTRAGAFLLISKLQITDRGKNCLQRLPFFFPQAGEESTAQTITQTDLALKSNADSPECDADTVSIIPELSHHLSDANWSGPFSRNRNQSRDLSYLPLLQHT